MLKFAIFTPNTKGTSMLTTLKNSLMLSSLLLLLPAGLMADLSKQDELKITKLCTDAISKKRICRLHL